MLATYRIQFQPDFVFAKACSLVSYLRELGISDLYASPLFEARRGSLHGYDHVNPRHVRKELGGPKGLDRLIRALQKYGMGVLLDLVPNHMCASGENPWWEDVERKGRASRYARYFDIDWSSSREHRRYRRFFDVDHLIGMRVEDPEVFAATHALALSLARRGTVNGFRLDHIDGLYDPERYLRKLRRAVGPRFTILVEKILIGDETLPAGWPVEGTSGYDFLSRLNGVLVDARGLRKLTDLYFQFTGNRISPSKIGMREKRLFLRGRFAPEFSRFGNDATEVAAHLSRYRTYFRGGKGTSADRAALRKAMKAARRQVSWLTHPRTMEEKRRRMEWQQYTGAVLAKGVEDSTLYLYNPLLSLNELGGGIGATSVAEFHRFLKKRTTEMNTTSTHDTKRSEDVRARLHVLSEIPEAWGKRLRKWSRWNRRGKTTVAPDRNEEVFIYQTLLGAWPISRKRLHDYFLKAMREARAHTSWQAPDRKYEQAVFRFVDRMLQSRRFRKDFLEFQEDIARWGAIKSLSQVLLKMMAPGIPDLYQGNEIWDFSLVDPDNRRLVDFDHRRKLLRSLRNNINAEQLLKRWEDGRIKMLFTQRSLQLRRRHPDVCKRGAYLPIPADSSWIAFARRYRKTQIVVVVPRWGSRISQLRLRLPGGQSRTWKEVLTGTTHMGNRVQLASSFPFALLESRA